MKFSGIACAAWLVPATLAAGPVPLLTRQDVRSITDRYLFNVPLSQFITLRNARNPPTLNWDSDGCSKSPDNPLGFDFEPACYRHDFGYSNYRAQGRFTTDAKDIIDTNFLSDLETQCASESLESICNALGNVYYTAVRVAGGQDASKRAEAVDVRQADAVAEYEEAVAAYEKLVAEAKANGQIPS